MHKFVLALTVALAAASAGAIPLTVPGPPPAAPPALTLVISVDGLTRSTFDRFRPAFTGGFARLATGVNATLEAGEGPLLGASPGLSALVESGRPASRSLQVAGSTASLATLGDPAADQVWLFDGRGFQQRTTAPQAAIANAANAAIARAIDTDEPSLIAPGACAAPPLATGGHRFARAAGDVAAFRASPQMNGTVLVFGAALARDLRLGRSSTTADILELGLTATAAVAAAHGADSQEMCLSLISLDRDLGDLFTHLDRSNLDYAVVLAGNADGPAPLLMWRKGWQSSTIPAPVQRSALAPTLARMLGAPPRDSGPCISGLPGVICPTL